MAEISALELTAGTAVVSVAVAAFAAFSPAVTDVLSDVTGQTRQGVDFGQQASVVSTVSVGIVLSYATHSLVPFVWSAIISVGLSVIYELAYRKGQGA